VRILFPINIDRWTNPIATLLREIAIPTVDLTFYAFSKPVSDEDRRQGRQFWSHRHIHRATPPDLLRRFDLVHHASATPANVTTARLVRWHSRPACRQIYTANVQPHRADRYYRWYARAVLQADVVVAVSRVVANDLQTIFGRRVHAIIPNGVDTAFFDRQVASPPDYTKLGIRPPYALFVGVLCQRKRPDLVIRLAQRMPAVQFVLVGGAYDPHEGARFRQLAADLRNVLFLGQQPRQMVRDLLCHASALVFPSELEGLALTVNEAMACGLPVLAQPRSSLPEQVQDGLTGWLLPVDEREEMGAWAERLKRVLDWTPAERQEFAQRARAVAVARYSWASIAAHYRQLYMQTNGA
jgi:glycosyltransferase involved in cell wall biosynthesis